MLQEQIMIKHPPRIQHSINKQIVAKHKHIILKTTIVERNQSQLNLVQIKTKYKISNIKFSSFKKV